MTKKLTFILLLIFALILAAPVLAQDDDEEEELPECPAFEDSATDVRVGYYMGEGEGYRASGQTQRAIDSFTCIIAVIDDSYLPAYINRAVLFAQRREYEESIEDYTTIIALDSSAIAAYNNRGIIYTVIGEYEEAMDDFDRVVSLDSSFVTGLNNRAVLHTLLGDYDAAIADLTDALSVSGITDIVAIIEDPERDLSEPLELPEFDTDGATTYALLGIVYSARALDNYETYISLLGPRSDQRIQSAAGALESRFTFELRLDDGSWLFSASFISEED